jgi:DNA-binding protein H-NS
MDLRHEDFVVRRNSPVAELERLRSQLDEQITAKRKQEMGIAAQRLKDAAIDMGFPIQELLPLLTEPVEHPVKYRHPQNPDLTWCGKGRRPLWMNRALNNGLTLSEMTV